MLNQNKNFGLKIKKNFKLNVEIFFFKDLKKREKPKNSSNGFLGKFFWVRVLEKVEFLIIFNCFKNF